MAISRGPTVKASTCFACLLVTAAAPVLASDVRINAYLRPPNEGVRNFNQVYLDGVRGGLLAYNAWAKKHSAKPAFCIPEGVVLSAEQVQAILFQVQPARDDMPIAILLMDGLQRTFPCSDAAK